MWQTHDTPAIGQLHGIEMRALATVTLIHEPYFNVIVYHIWNILTICTYMGIICSRRSSYSVHTSAIYADTGHVSLAHGPGNMTMYGISSKLDESCNLHRFYVLDTFSIPWDSYNSDCPSESYVLEVPSDRFFCSAYFPSRHGRRFSTMTAFLCRASPTRCQAVWVHA